MKALSIRQPWATLITIGLPVYDSVSNEDGTSRVEFRGKMLIKDIENRTWPLPKGFEVPQRIYVHASKSEDNEALEWLLAKGFPAFPVLMMFTQPKGAIVGEIDILGCVTESESPWFQGHYGFVLANPMPYRYPIPYRGKLGFFEVTINRRRIEDMGEILDIGAGREPSPGATRAIDKNKDHIINTRRVYGPIRRPRSLHEYRQASAERIPYPDGFFSKVISRWALGSHIFSRRAYKEIRRVLKPTGRVEVWILWRDRRYKRRVIEPKRCEIILVVSGVTGLEQILAGLGCQLSKMLE